MDTSSVLLPPGGPLEVVFSFDTTGSMYCWLNELRGRIQDMIQRLQADIPGIRMAVFAHGDYCDKHIYVTKWIDFTNDIVKLCDFVKNVEQTGGGDAPECYELVLRQVRTELSWTPKSRRVLVLIGDNKPHEPNEACNKDKIDWRLEVKALAQEAVTIYGVQCGHTFGADTFYQAISLATGGKHLHLADFGSLFDTLMAVCYREGSDTAMLAGYEKEVRARCGGIGLAADIDAIFASLKCDGADSSAILSDLFSPVKKSYKSAKPSDRKKLISLIPSGKTSSAKASSGKTLSGKTSSGKISSEKKTTAPKSGLDKFKDTNLPLLKRENVPENNFNLRSLNWHPLTLVMVSDHDLPTKRPEMWEKRECGPGYRLKKLSLSKPSVSKNHKMAVLYEVAVQGNGSKKRRYVVLSRFSRSLGAKRWEFSLLGKASSQVNHLLKVGGRVYMRFCYIASKTVLESSKKSVKRYDYAWSKIKNMRSCPRDVVKGGVIISRSN